MKKSIVLCLMMMVSVMTYAFDGEATVNGIRYKIITKGKDAKVCRSENNEKQYVGNIVIPATIEYEGVVCNVTAICVDAFRSSNITSVTIPSSVKEIERGAFLLLKNLLKWKSVMA